MRVKMICCDLDGTLLTYDQTALSERFLDLVRRLHKKGILFVPTSGRQIVSVMTLFRPITECCRYICSNGAVLCDSTGTVTDRIVMPKDEVVTIAKAFFEQCNGRSEVNLAGAERCHLMCRDLGIEERLRYIGNDCERISSPSEVTDGIVKVSAFLPDGAEHYIAYFKERFPMYEPVIAGDYWIDIMNAHKGLGVQNLCRSLNILPEEVMAFGDNYNDETMLDLVGIPYIMDTAPKELLDKYPNHTASVEDTLEALYEQFETLN